MIDLLKLFPGADDPGPESPPTHFIALILRCEESLLLERSKHGLTPFMTELSAREELPPTLGSESVLLWVRRSAKLLTLEPESILSHDMRPPEPFQPFANVFTHVVILDVSRSELERIHNLRRLSVVVTANHVMQNVGRNFFFRTISEAYRIPAHGA